MEVVIRTDAAAAAELAARIIAGEVRARPRLVLGLAAGVTMEAVYARLVAMHREKRVDFSTCRTFNLDEYVGLPGSDPHSYRAYMNQHLFGHVNIPPRNTNLPDGMAVDLDAECARYERLIREAGGIDLQLLGIGRTGHLGFNEPMSAFRSRTRVAVLSQLTREQNAPLFSSPDKVPQRALTMGLGTILDARRCLLLATGADKADVVAKAIEGPQTGAVPASALQLHAATMVVLDEAAASGLANKDYYHSASENEPSWASFR